MEYAYRLLNVFAETKFGGNPLCVFEHADDLSTEEMQAIAMQFNLSETVFLTESSFARTKKMRIFTPSSELPFAGHPTLGAAQVVCSLMDGLTQFSLECRAGIVEVQFHENRWSLLAPVSAPFSSLLRPVGMPSSEIASMLGIAQEDLLGEPMWANTGNEHLMIPVRSSAVVERARMASDQLEAWPVSQLGRQNAYIFAFNGEEQLGKRMKARYWFAKAGSVAEDPATGSAAANLGAWWLAQNPVVAQSFVIEQGHEMQRPSRLYVHVELDINQVPRIAVSGSVIEIGSGVLHL